MIKTTIAATACAFIAAAVVAKPQDDERKIPFASSPTFSLTVNQHTVIVRRGTESVVVTKADMRRYINAKDAMGDLDSVPREHFDGLLVHCQGPIAELFFVERAAAIRRQGQGEKG